MIFKSSNEIIISFFKNIFLGKLKLVGNLIWWLRYFYLILLKKVLKINYDFWIFYLGEGAAPSPGGGASPPGRETPHSRNEHRLKHLKSFQAINTDPDISTSLHNSKSKRPQNYSNQNNPFLSFFKEVYKEIKKEQGNKNN